MIFVNNKKFIFVLSEETVLDTYIFFQNLRVDFYDDRIMKIKFFNLKKFNNIHRYH